METYEEFLNQINTLYRKIDLLNDEACFLEDNEKIRQIQSYNKTISVLTDCFIFKTYNI